MWVPQMVDFMDHPTIFLDEKMGKNPFSGVHHLLKNKVVLPVNYHGY